MSIHFNKDNFILYLRQNRIQEENVLNTIIAIFDEFDNKDGVTDSCISNQKALMGFCQKCDANPILASLKNLTINYISNLKPQTVENLNPQLNYNNNTTVKTTYLNARDRLVAELQSGQYEFVNPQTNEKYSANRLITYLNKLDFYTNNDGSAEAKKDSGEILVNTTPNGRCINQGISQAEAMKILLHEALHCEYKELKLDPGFNTQEEEMFCESQAIKLTAQMLKENEDTNLYNSTISELAQSPNLDSILRQEFIKSRYSHRPKNSSGDVNIEGFEIKNGYTVYVNNRPIGTIGNPSEGNLLLDEISENDIRAAGSAFGSMTKVVLQYQDNAEPLIIKDLEGNVIFEAYIVEQNNNQKHAFGL